MAYSNSTITFLAGSSNTFNNNKYGYGAYLNNTSSTTNAGVSVLGSNIFNNNKLDGLLVLTKGDIDLAAITAGSDLGSGNGDNGANLDNSAGSGNVNINGTGIFNGNAGSGLKIISNGVLNLSNITANKNISGYGAYLIAMDAVSSVTLNGINTFSNNRLDGLHVETNGNIAVFGATANSNGDASSCAISTDTIAFRVKGGNAH